MRGELSSEPVLGIRADADTQIGSGHVLRSLAIAQAWMERGGKAVFISSSSLSPAFQRRLRGEGVEIQLLEKTLPGSKEDAALTKKIIDSLRINCLLVDGYHFSEVYQRTFKNSVPLILLDDTAESTFYDADIIINPNAYASPKLYEGKTSARHFLTGASFALLRREFRQHRPEKKFEKDPDIINLLITMGGGDAPNVTGKILDALSDVQDQKIRVKAVLGADNPHRANLEAQVLRLSFPVEFILAPENMVPLLEWANSAVTAGGSTCWETAYMGVPSLCVILAENQRRIVRYLEDSGIVRSLGDDTNLKAASVAQTLKHLLADQDSCRAMSKKGQALIDGKGALRCVDLIFKQLSVSEAK